MKTSLCVATVTLALALAPATARVAGAATPAQRQGAMGMGGRAVEVRNVVAGPYLLTLDIGPLERMYTVAEYNRLHPTSGEIMLRGAMMMGGMGMGMPNHHLEIHVMRRGTMRVVSDAMVAISYEPVARMGEMALRPTTLPIAVMRGIGMGMMDIHYGNNVYMPRGAYRIMARVNKAYATYTVRLM